MSNQNHGMKIGDRAWSVMAETWNVFLLTLYMEAAHSSESPVSKLRRLLCSHHTLEVIKINSALMRVFCYADETLLK